ncbi:hypothetical protein K3495_g10407 [Podosphaera aphanis]|nr:hypothetical protein K3495_g10407 [Podosphaera aphanis]
MSLYHTTAEILTLGTCSLRSQIFKKIESKSQAAQIYALAVETCKWSLVLKEVIENADFLRAEPKLTPILSVLLVHDLLLAKKGIALPVTHGLRMATEKHKTRLQAEFTKSRVRRKLASLAAFKEYVEVGLDDEHTSSEPYPRWVRVNTLKTTLEEQLETTFSGYERSSNIKDVRQRGHKRLFIDTHIPNLIALSPNSEISKSAAYLSGAIIFQDKASCFPAYLLDPYPSDGDFIDTCSAPGNKTTHLAAILTSRLNKFNSCPPSIHAFEKNKSRAETLKKMVELAGSDPWTKIHPNQDFLMTDPNSLLYKNVGALLLDPSCSGSGIVGRDERPVLHLPTLKQKSPSGHPKNKKKNANPPVSSRESKKRKREEPEGNEVSVCSDSEGEQKTLNPEELKDRLTALSKFQLELLLHAFKFPAARKITYSTCSIHAEENELVIRKALEHPYAKEKGWRILKRDEQPQGMSNWPVRGSQDTCGVPEDLAMSCIRTNKGDEHGTMGFFVAALVRDIELNPDVISREFKGQKRSLTQDQKCTSSTADYATRLEIDTGLPSSTQKNQIDDVDDEWNGIIDDDLLHEEQSVLPLPPPSKKAARKQSKSRSQKRQKA